ncbi:MAG: TRAP transporter TatT component family protein [Acidobacteriota bacterium]
MHLLQNVRKSALLLIMLSLLIAAEGCRKQVTAPENAGSGRPAAQAIAEADQLYAGRADLTKVRKGLVALRQSQADDPTNYELAWRLAKFNYYLGAHSPESSEKEKAFHDGIAAGKLAVRLQDGKPEGHFWLGANYGGNAKLSVLSGLSEFNDIKSEMETVLKLDEGYQSGSAYMALGQLYLEAPRMLGGDTQKAIEYLEKGLRFGPDNALLRWHLAAAYAQANRNDDARKQIDYLLAMKPAPGYEPEHQEALAEVRKLQEKMKHASG